MRAEVAEIRARYAGYSLNSGNAHWANDDRGWLLSEVDRQRAEIERLRAEIDGLEAEQALLNSGLDIALRILGDKP